MTRLQINLIAPCIVKIKYNLTCQKKKIQVIQVVVINEQAFMIKVYLVEKQKF
jgi:hypothetical protein